MYSELTGIILSGGKGSRMGNTNKALLRLRDTQIIKIKLESLEPLCREVLVVNQKPEVFPEGRYRQVLDKKPGIGPLMGLYSGLLESKTRYSFVTACDMPFFRKELFSYLFSLTEGYDVVIPDIQGYMEPMFAFYSRDCIPEIEKALDRKETKMRSFFHRIKRLSVDKEHLEKYDPGLVSFFNINTHRDYESVKKYYEEQSQKQVTPFILEGYYDGVDSEKIGYPV